jgi:choice-of-anchor B domain-containing protein
LGVCDIYKTKILFRIILILVTGFYYSADGQQQMVPHLSLTAQWNGHGGSEPYNSLWGWSGNGREYAILGSLDSIYFFDITNPYKIKLCDARAGRFNNCRNREFKTYKHYCYAVADQGNSSLQIFDLATLPDSVHKVYDSDTLSTDAHNLFIDHDRLYLAYNKRSFVKNGHTIAEGNNVLTVASLQNPEIPVFISNLHPNYVVVQGVKKYDFEYVHDLFVRNDTAYLACGYDGLFVYNYKDPINPVLFAAFTADNGQGLYNHSCWLSEDGNWLVNTDETNGARIKLFDVSQLKDSTNKAPQIEEVCLFGSHAAQGAVAHNSFFKGNLIYTSYYQEGVVIFDMTDPLHTKKLSSYDTYPQNGNTFSGLHGCWNVYPYFASGSIIASDMSNGLFVLKQDSVSAIHKAPDQGMNITVLENPFQDAIRLKITSQSPGNAEIMLFDVQGRELHSETASIPLGSAIISIPAVSIKNNAAIILKISTSSGIFETLMLRR